MLVLFAATTTAVVLLAAVIVPYGLLNGVLDGMSGCCAYLSGDDASLPKQLNVGCQQSTVRLSCGSISKGMNQEVLARTKCVLWCSRVSLHAPAGQYTFCNAVLPP